MSFTTAEARRELMEGFAEAIEDIGAALTALGDAYEQLDEHTADRLEATLFGPVQRAYGQAKSTYTAFAARHGLAKATFAQAAGGAPSRGAGGFIEDAVESAARADAALSELQDSHSFAEVGDVELRSGITGVRQLLAQVPPRARELQRTLGR